LKYIAMVTPWKLLMRGTWSQGPDERDLFPWTCGTYTPISGDFNGDGHSDVFWYGPGGDRDSLWYGQSGLGAFDRPR
jgi:FG-GAP repeat